MARKTIAGLEGDLSRVRKRRDYWASRSRHWRRLVMWASPCALIGWSAAIVAVVAAIARTQPINVHIPSSEPQRMSMRTVGEPPTTGKYSITRTSPSRVLASVRIGRGGGCSGTIIKRVGDSAWGISAGHCATRVHDQFTIGNPDGSEASARWIAIDRTLDLSLFITWSKDVLSAAKVTSAYQPDWGKNVEAIGYPGGSGPKWKRFRYARTEGHGESGSRRYFPGRYLFRNLGPGMFAGGDSGGGVFYDGDYLVGVMTHGGPHAASLPQIQKFLTSNAKLFKGNSPFS